MMEIQITVMAVTHNAKLSLVGNVIVPLCQAVVVLFVVIAF